VRAIPLKNLWIYGNIKEKLLALNLTSPAAFLVFAQKSAVGEWEGERRGLENVSVLVTL
jgi:hypothetical protein